MQLQFLIAYVFFFNDLIACFYYHFKLKTQFSNRLYQRSYI